MQPNSFHRLQTVAAALQMDSWRCLQYRYLQESLRQAMAAAKPKVCSNCQTGSPHQKQPDMPNAGRVAAPRVDDRKTHNRAESFAPG